MKDSNSSVKKVSDMFHIVKVSTRDISGENIGLRGIARDAIENIQERTAELRELNALLEAERRAMETRLESLKEQREISAEFVSAIDSIDSPIRKAIASVGEFSGADRVSIFIFNNDSQTMNSIYKWCAESVDVEGDDLRGYPIPTSALWMDKVRNDEVISIPDISNITPEEQAELEMLQGQNVRSILVLPINTQRKLNGLMMLSSSFDNNRSNGEWDVEYVQLSRMVSDTISAALERIQSEKELRNTREAQAYAQGRLEIIDTILHNIGNAINSVTIGIGTIQENLVNSKLERHLFSLANATKEHQDDFSDYVRSDPQGQKVAPFIIALADEFAKRDEELAKTVSRVRERAEHIADIIRAEKMLGRKSVYSKDISLREAIDNATVVLRDSIRKRGIDISIDCNSAPEEISTQESQFHQMLVNLIKNSIEAIDDLEVSGGMSDTPFIKINSYIESDSLILEVNDNGIGIEKDNLDIIFRSGYTTKDSGSGLGLHLIANFVNECGGQIVASSDGIGRGANMRVTLPLSTAAACK
jgi:signal transduction histidine kinase